MTTATSFFLYRVFNQGIQPIQCRVDTNYLSRVKARPKAEAGFAQTKVWLSGRCYALFALCH